MNLNKRQQQIVEAKDDAILCLAGAGSGKALPNSVKIPTPDGWKLVGEIKVGDYLFDRNGHPTKVLGVYPQGKRRVYQLIFEDGRTAKSSADHVWAVYTSPDNEAYEEKTLSEILDAKRRYYIPNIKPVQYSNTLLNPYTAGKQAEEKGFLGDFKYTNSVDRALTLQGLMDSSGFVMYFDNTYHALYTTKHQQLAKDFIELIESLGYAGICKYIEQKQAAYQVQLILPNKEIPNIFYDRHKRDKVKVARNCPDPRRYDRIEIVDIKDLGYEEEMTCFLVDNEEHLFLTEHFICTHNTRVLTERIRHLIKNEGVKPEEIVAITFTNLAANEMHKRLEDVCEGMYIGTIHSYANRICIYNGLDTTDLIRAEEFDELLRMAADYAITKYPKITHLLIDEAQDISSLECAFINTLPADNIFLVGDDKQNIFQFRGCTDRYMKNLYNNKRFVKYYLNENYRNAPNIITYATGLLGTYESLGLESIAVKQKDGFIDDKASFEEVIDEIKASKNWNSWFVLTRTNMELDKAYDMLEDEGIPCITFKKSDIESQEEFDELMNSDKVKVLTMHSCISGDTLVPTSEGLMRIDEIVKRKDKNLLIYNGKYYDKVLNFIENGEELTYTLITKHGASIRLTENHDCIVLTENGLKKVKVKDLNGDETLLIRKNIRDYRSEKIPLIPVKKEELHRNALTYNLPEFLDENLAELVGMITADGTHNDLSIHYTKQYKECVERFASLVYLCFGKKIEIKRQQTEEAWYAACNSTQILKFLYKNFNGIENKNKHISSKILSANQSIQCAFLRGLFEDGSVGMKKDRVDNITLTYKNPQMTYELQTLLYSLGIDATFTTHNYKNQSLNYCYIYVEGMRIFKEKINFISNFKRDRLEKLEVKRPRKNASSVLKAIMLKNREKAYVDGNKRFWTNLEKNSCLTEYYFNQYYQLLSEEQKNIPDIMFIKEIFDNYQLESLDKKEVYQEELTYCLTMEHENQFIQNGFLMGNSKGMERRNVVSIGARLFNITERKLAYVAATRAETNLYVCPSIIRRGEKYYSPNKRVRGEKLITF